MGVKLVSAAYQWADANHRYTSPCEKRRFIIQLATKQSRLLNHVWTPSSKKRSRFAGVTYNMMFQKILKIVLNELLKLMKLWVTQMMMFLQICMHPSVWQLMCGWVISSRPKDATLSWGHIGLMMKVMHLTSASWNKIMSRQCTLCT